MLRRGEEGAGAARGPAGYVADARASPDHRASLVGGPSNDMSSIMSTSVVVSVSSSRAGRRPRRPARARRPRLASPPALGAPPCGLRGGRSGGGVSAVHQRGRVQGPGRDRRAAASGPFGGGGGLRRRRRTLSSAAAPPAAAVAASARPRRTVLLADRRTPTGFAVRPGPAARRAPGRKCEEGRRGVRTRRCASRFALWRRRRRG